MKIAAKNIVWPVVFCMLFGVFLLTHPQNSCAQFSADFSGGSVHVGDDTGTCSPTEAGALKYDPAALGSVLESPSFGLLAHWPMDTIVGGITQDVVGAHNGTVTNAYVSTNIGVVAGSIRTSGATNSTITVGDALDFPGNAPYTIVVWFNAQSYAVAYPSIISKLNTTGTREGYFFGIHDGSVEPTLSMNCGRFLNSVQSNVTYSVGPFPVKSWHHVVCTYDGARLRLYWNGVLVKNTSSPAAIIDNTNAFVISRNSDAYTDDVRIYNRALSLTEIQTLYVCGLNGVCAGSGGVGLQYCNGAKWKRL